MWGLADEYAKQHKTDKWAYYHTKEFRQYVDDYADFVKKGKLAIDYYSNVDVIPNPELSWRNLKYLENKHGLRPVPVIHYPSPHSWIERHIQEGYDYIALGGLVGSHSMDVCRQWIDRAFDIVCDQPSRLPKVRVHGFGMTSYELLLHYPWFSVDSSYWCKQGAFGRILVPQKQNGKFSFSRQPYSIATSNDAKERGIEGQHYFSLNSSQRAVVNEWLHFIGIRIGSTNLETGLVQERGVTNNHSYRKAANIYFFRELLKSLPDYPWPFKGVKRSGGFTFKFADGAMK